MNALLQHHAEFFGNAVDVRCIGLRLIRQSLSLVGPCTVPMPRDNPASLPARACTQRTSRNSPDRPTVTHIVCALHDSRSALEQVTVAISERSTLFQSDRAGRSSVAGRTKKNPGTLVGLVLADKRLIRVENNRSLQAPEISGFSHFSAIAGCQADEEILQELAIRVN